MQVSNTASCAVQTGRFSLSPSFYAARCESSIILLDLANDRYFSLIEEAARYFGKICDEKLVFNQGIYAFLHPDSEGEEKLNRWIKEFVEKGYINFTIEGGRGIAKDPLKKGGLCDYQWDSKHSWTPFSAASKVEIIKAFFVLAKVHRFLKKGEMKAGVEWMDSLLKPIRKNPRDAEVEKLAAAVDAATLLYPTKSYCLAWAMTFAVLSLKKRWNIDFVIGVQSSPFYAHAWVEQDGKVINDDPRVREYLSKIYQGPQG